MADNGVGSTEKKHKLTVTVDLPGVLVILLILSFVIMAGTIGYGLASGKLKPEIVLGIVSTIFSGILAGALTTWIANNKKSSNGDK